MRKKDIHVPGTGARQVPGLEQVQRQRPEDPNNDASKPGIPQTNVDNLQTREQGTVASYLDKGADLLGIGKWIGDKNSTGICLRSLWLKTCIKRSRQATMDQVRLKPVYTHICK